MSLILDALRKSERTRQQSLTGQLGAGETPPPPARLHLPWTTLLGLLLLMNAVALAVLFWRSGSDKPAAPAPLSTVLPAVATPYRPEVRPLADEAGAQMVTATRPAPKPTAAQASQAIVPAAQPQASTPAPALPQVSDAVPTLDTLPADVRQTLPVLHLDVLGYAPEPKQRFVVINLQRYTIGDSLPEGARVLDITSQGAVLEFHGTRFLLAP